MQAQTVIHQVFCPGLRGAAGRLPRGMGWEMEGLPPGRSSGAEGLPQGWGEEWGLPLGRAW